MRPSLISTLTLLLAGGVASVLGEELVFERDIRPILKVACFHCHGEEEENKGGLDVRLVRLMVEGGESGSVLTPGDVEGSLLWKKIASNKMPKGEKKLSSQQKERVRLWIAQGARTARPEPEDVNEARFTVEELEHWAYQPVREVAVPDNGEVGIDAFLLRRLADKGLGFSERADRRHLIRRATFAVTGLPPSPAEVETFVTDEQPGAWQRLVDRLLASPQFGVRWARHWLDTAGYAESEGDAREDPGRPHAWHYRDYVVNAFNANKPIDEFITEQLAGDELIEGELAVDNPRHLELLAATGFMRMAPDATQRTNTLVDRNFAVAGAIHTISSSLLGITVNCAQCHDHKYDPIGIDDYYGLRAIFDPAFSLTAWQQPASRLVDMTAAEVRAERAGIEAEAKKLDDELAARRKGRGAEIRDEKIAAVPEEDREAVRVALFEEPGKRSAEQKALLERYPMVKPVPVILGLLVEYDGASFRKFEEEKKKIAELRSKMPPLRMVRVTTERAGNVPVSKVFFRGDPENPKQVVEPAELLVLRRGRTDQKLPLNDESLKTTGRRLAYARQLTDGSHPLTARVFVNRVWMHYFGRGLVATPGDFGISGERPSHPALLDWLATDFVKHAWDHKRLHRMILLSKSFQQRSQRREDLNRIDPDNVLLGRANLRRLEAEAVRDALLSVSGQLLPDLGGPPVAVIENEDGKAVLGAGDSKRRSLYVGVQRRLPLNMLAVFDQPPMVPNCDRRRPTTVATQALWFLNDEESIQRSDQLAQSLIGESGEQEERLRQLFLRLFGEPPTADELKICMEVLGQQQQRFEELDPKTDPERTALASLCQVLLASNRFLYLD